MIKGYEIERRFLVQIPKIQELDVKRKIDILQTYLVSGENTLAGLYNSNYPVGRTFQGGVEISF